MEGCGVVTLLLHQLRQAWQFFIRVVLRCSLIVRDVKRGVYDKLGIRGVSLPDHLVKMFKVNVVLDQLVNYWRNFLPVNLQVDQEVLK
ncbi:hypothetical protein D3C76_1779510 [compost metagenome]